jgi:hypothetical protein
MEATISNFKLKNGYHFKLKVNGYNLKATSSSFHPNCFFQIYNSETLQMIELITLF